MKYSMQYTCPKCDEDVFFDIRDEDIVCDNCKTKLKFDCDAEFVDGQWKDLSKLYEPKTSD